MKALSGSTLVSGPLLLRSSALKTRLIKGMGGRVLEEEGNAAYPVE